MKIGRNDLCWCGSRSKYKNCHMNYDQKIQMLKDQGKEVPSNKLIKTEEQIKGIRKAGEINTMILNRISPYIKAGITTDEINTMVHNFTVEYGGIPAPLNYKGFPKSVCTSINDVVCHGIPAKRELVDGDIINIDVTTIFQGFYGDSSRMFLIGDVEKNTCRLVAVAKECLELGLRQVKAWIHLGDVGAAIQEHAERNGFNVVREIGGHGVGIDFHEEPWVGHVGLRGTGMVLVPGMVITIEPMINMGKADIFEDEMDGWTIYTEDAKPSAQWEYTVLVTETGAEILAR